MLCRRAARAVQHQHRLAGRLADRGVVQPQFRHGLAGVEFEIPRDPVALLRRRIVGRERGKRGQGKRGRQRRTRNLHDGLPESRPPCRGRLRASLSCGDAVEQRAASQIRGKCCEARSCTGNITRLSSTSVSGRSLPAAVSVCHLPSAVSYSIASVRPGTRCSAAARLGGGERRGMARKRSRKRRRRRCRPSRRHARRSCR